jgi:signal-transduction protein with cAMP-binding, CBS, and nucleotidyltransferase domain
MTIIDKIFILKKISPFDRLKDSQIAVIAEVAKEQVFEPDKIVSSKEKIQHRLYITIEGSIITEIDQKTIPQIFGLESLLFDLPISDTLKASDEGAVCLVISKKHFFTIMYECPELVLGFLEKTHHPTEYFYQFMKQGS